MEEIVAAKIDSAIDGQSKKNSEKKLEHEISELNEQSKRMQNLIERVDLLPDSESKELMRECISQILVFYGNGLERIMNILMNEGNTASTKILNDLLDDSFING